MNSGKSTALMQVAHNYEEQGMRVLILKPQVDTKGGGELVSRLGVRRKADLLIPPETDVFEAVRTANADGAPLACAARMPSGESSKMIVSAGATPKCSMAIRKPSGAGFLCGTSTFVSSRSKQFSR